MSKIEHSKTKMPRFVLAQKSTNEGTVTHTAILDVVQRTMVEILIPIGSRIPRVGA